ncbi:MAG: DNA polymerase, partial [Gloeomargaritales cyanobacterium]
DNPDIRVMGTLNPKAVEISPRNAKGFESDLRFFVSQVNGQALREYGKTPVRVLTDNNYRELSYDCANAHGVSFDLETNSLEEYKSDSIVICIALALWGKEATDVEKVWVIPLYHPQSKHITYWRGRFHDVCQWIKDIPVRVAQNAKFDCRWTVEFGDEVTATFCTMLAAHIINENRSKSLESLTREEMGTPSWKINTKNLLDEPLKKVLKYNAEDALNTGRLYFILREQLKRQLRLARIFMKIMMPLSNELVHDERFGVWIDRKRLNERWQIVKDRLVEIDDELQGWVPEKHPHEINFNTSNFLRWWLFEHLGVPVIQLTEKGFPCLDLPTKQHLKDAHPVMPLLIERAGLMKMHTAFFSAYHELIDSDDRIHTNFRIAGTTTGRLSSGQGDTEKALVKPDRAINLQQVPTDPFVRGVIGAPETKYFIEADFATQEFRIGAMLANDSTAIEAFRTGKDIHRMMAAVLVNKSLEEITKSERTRAKPVNFLYLFGGMEKMFIETAWREYQIVFTIEEARKARRAFFNTWTAFEPWHEKQRAFARQHGYVTTLLGRVRRLPDVHSKVDTIRWHAERQAINAPVQGLGTDLTQFSYLLIKQALRDRGLDHRVISMGTVHDSLMFEGQDYWSTKAALPIIKYTMENLPLKQTFGVELTVPMVAELSVGQHWGEGTELKTFDDIENWKGLV